MIRKLGLMAALLAFTFMAMAPSANAYNEADHVYVAANGVGDALVFPAYIVGGTFKTNIRVINTSNTYSVVAKVVFREGFSCCETRDFFIYLSPNDVWEAEIIDKNGKVTIVSDDDSSPIVPLEIAMATSCNGFPDVIGLIEVYEAYAFANFREDGTCGDNGCSGGDIVSAPIPKQLIKDAYDEAPNSLANLNCANGFTCVSFESGNNDYCVQVYRSKNVLTGVEEMVDPSAGMVLPQPATALANNCNAVKLTVNEETRWDNYGNNTDFEVRAALAKETIHIPFRSDNKNSTLAVLSFPAKLSCCLSGTDDCDGSISACDATTNRGDECLHCDSFIGNDYDCLHMKEHATTWAYKPYDMEENTPKKDDPVFSPVPPSGERPPLVNCVEVLDLEDFNGVDTTASYTEGWVRITMTDACCQRFGATREAGKNIWYNGSAVIPTYVEVGNGDIAWIASSYDCANVIVTNDASTENCGAPTPVNCGSFDNCSYQVISPNMTPLSCGQ